MPAMQEARALMVDHCAGRFDMLELGQAVEYRCRRPQVASAASRLVTASLQTSQGH
jgi:hypothetical protein